MIIVRSDGFHEKLTMLNPYLKQCQGCRWLPGFLMFRGHGNTIVQMMIQMILQFTWVHYDDYEFYDQVVCAQIESFTSLKVGIKSLDERST